MPKVATMPTRRTNIATRTSMIEKPADRTCEAPRSQRARQLAARPPTQWIQRDADVAGRRGAGRSQQLPTGLSKTIGENAKQSAFVAIARACSSGRRQECYFCVLHPNSARGAISVFRKNKGDFAFFGEISRGGLIAQLDGRRER